MYEKISVAPMVDRTTTKFRDFIRIFNKSSTLYTEMITAKALIYGDVDKLLKYNKKQHKLVVQVAPTDEKEMLVCVQNAIKYNFDEININAGCPSNRVSDNKMGASLMARVDDICKMIKVAKDNTDIPVSIKHRIGIDGRGVLYNNEVLEGFDFLNDFVDKLFVAGSSKSIIHARKAILKGLSPNENRKIPELDYNIVYRIKRENPNRCIEINGGIINLDEVAMHLKQVDSVMIGRACYDNPMILNELSLSYEQILEEMIIYLENTNDRPYYFTMHTLGLFYNTKFSKIWKNIASNTKVDASDLRYFLDKYKSKY